MLSDLILRSTAGQDLFPTPSVSAVQKASGRNEGPTAAITQGFRSSDTRSSTPKEDDLMTVEQGN